MGVMDDDLRARRVEVTKRNLAEAQRISDQEWIDAEEAILRSLERS